MTLQTPKDTWLRHEVLDDDPMWPERISVQVVAMPAPGYAICWSHLSSGHQAGFLEIEFTAEEPTLIGDGGTAVITDLQWTWAVQEADVDALGVDFGQFAPRIQNFPEDSTLVGIHIPSVIGNFEDGYILHYAATYGTTFGSLSVGSLGRGRIELADETNEGDVDAIALTADLIVWTWAILANEHVDPLSARQVIHTGIQPVGDVDDDLWDDDHPNVHHFEPTSSEPQQLHLRHNGSSSDVMAWGIGSGSTRLSTTIASDGALATPFASHGSTPAPDSGSTLDNTHGEMYFRGSPSSGTSTEIVDDWFETRPELEANNASIVGGTGAQHIASGVMEGNDGSSVRRTWDPDTGENLDAWSIGTRLRVQVDPPAWIGSAFFSGHDRLQLFTEAPPDPGVPEFDPHDDGACLQALSDPEYQVDPNDDGSMALIDDDTLFSYTGNVPEDYVASLVRFPYPCVARPPQSAVELDQSSYPDTYHRSIAAAARDGVIYWFDRNGDPPPSVIELREGESGSIVWDLDTGVDWGVDGTFDVRIVWNDDDQAFYVMVVVFEFSSGDHTWTLYRVDPTGWSHTTVGTGLTPASVIWPTVTPDGAVWFMGMETDDWPGWARYIPSTDTLTITDWKHWPYWGSHNEPHGRDDGIFIPRADSSVWFWDDNEAQWLRLEADGTITDPPQLDALAYDNEEVTWLPDASIVVLRNYNFPPDYDDYLFQLGPCDPIVCGVAAWTVGRGLVGASTGSWR